MTPEFERLNERLQEVLAEHSKSKDLHAKNSLTQEIVLIVECMREVLGSWVQ